MEYNQHENHNKSQPDLANRMALFSVMIGVFSFLACSRPDLQFGASVAGILCAIFSKKQDSLSGLALVGLILSILSLLFSLYVTAFLCLFFTLEKDSAHTPILTEVLTTYKHLFQNMQVK